MYLKIYLKLKYFSLLEASPGTQYLKSTSKFRMKTSFRERDIIFNFNKTLYT